MMNFRPIPISLAILSLFLVVGQGSQAQSSDELVVVVHPGVSDANLNSSDLAAIFTGRRRNWRDGQRVIAFNLPAGDPARVRFDTVVLGMDAERAARFWIDERVRGGPRPPRQAPSAILVVRIVAQMEGAIGYVPAGLARGSGARIVARIRGSQVVPP